MFQIGSKSNAEGTKKCIHIEQVKDVEPRLIDADDVWGDERDQTYSIEKRNDRLVQDSLTTSKIDLPSTAAMTTFNSAVSVALVKLIASQ